MESYVRWLAQQKNGRRVNHWSKDRLPFDTDSWDRCYPKFATTDLHEGIGRYWDTYYARVEEIAEKHREAIRVYDVEQLLNDAREIAGLLSWLGIPESQQVVAQVHANRGPRPAASQELAHDAVLGGADARARANTVALSGDVASVFGRALAAHQTGRMPQAMAGYCDTLRIDPDHAGAYHLKGLIHHERGENELAFQSIQAALARCDSKGVYWNNFGVILLALERYEEARVAFERALAIVSDYADALANLGLLHQKQERTDEARQCFADALEIDPKHPDALYRAGSLALRRGQLDKAIERLRAAVAVAPDRFESFQELGKALAADGQHTAAAEVYRHAASLRPGSAEIQWKLAGALAKSGWYEEARRCFLRAGELRPDRPVWRFRHLGLCPVVFESEEAIHEYRREVERELDRLIDETVRFDRNRLAAEGGFPSFYLSHHGVCSRRIKAKFAKAFEPTFRASGGVPDMSDAGPPGDRNGRIRVGFVVTGGHEGGFLRGMSAVVDGFDRAKVEPVVFCAEKALKRVAKGIRSDAAVVAFPASFLRTVGLIREARCDVVYHWQIGTDPKNYFLPFERLAPVQCTSWGSHDTTGIPGVDYFLSSEFVERSDADEDYTESLHRFRTLPTWQPWPKRARPTSREELGLPDGGPLFFCPHRLAKLHPALDGLLRRLLADCGMARVLMIEGTRQRENEILQRRLRKSLGKTLYRRVLFCPRLDGTDFYRVLSVSTAVLDSPVYSGGLTAYDAFGYEVPVVTLEGPLMCARYTAGLYRRMGIDDLIAADCEDYVRIAVQIGKEPDYCEQIRRELAERNQVLFEDASAIIEHETFFLSCGKMARSKWGKGLSGVSGIAVREGSAFRQGAVDE